MIARVMMMGRGSGVAAGTYTRVIRVTELATGSSQHIFPIQKALIRGIIRISHVITTIIDRIGRAVGAERRVIGRNATLLRVQVAMLGVIRVDVRVARVVVVVE